MKCGRMVALSTECSKVLDEYNRKMPIVGLPLALDSTTWTHVPGFRQQLVRGFLRAWRIATLPMPLRICKNILQM